MPASTGRTRGTLPRHSPLYCPWLQSHCITILSASAYPKGSPVPSTRRGRR